MHLENHPNVCILLVSHGINDLGVRCMHEWIATYVLRGTRKCYAVLRECHGRKRG
jgi:hypothetical protein